MARSARPQTFGVSHPFSDITAPISLCVVDTAEVIPVCTAPDGQFPVCRQTLPWDYFLLVGKQKVIQKPASGRSQCK